jgi:hypothetical protein
MNRTARITISGLCITFAEPKDPALLKLYALPHRHIPTTAVLREIKKELNLK